MKPLGGSSLKQLLISPADGRGRQELQCQCTAAATASRCWWSSARVRNPRRPPSSSSTHHHPPSTMAKLLKVGLCVCKFPLAPSGSELSSKLNENTAVKIGRHLSFLIWVLTVVFFLCRKIPSVVSQSLWVRDLPPFESLINHRPFCRKTGTDVACNFRNSACK